MAEKQFLVEESLLVKILNYLAQRPFVEVFQLVNELQSLKPNEKTK